MFGLYSAKLRLYLLVFSLPVTITLTNPRIIAVTLVHTPRPSSTPPLPQSSTLPAAGTGKVHGVKRKALQDPSSPASNNRPRSTRRLTRQALRSITANMSKSKRNVGERPSSIQSRLIYDRSLSWDPSLPSNRCLYPLLLTSLNSPSTARPNPHRPSSTISNQQPQLP